jgi:hypothetical protein
VAADELRSLALKKRSRAFRASTMDDSRLALYKAPLPNQNGQMIMNTRTKTNDKPLFEIDAYIVLRLNAGDNVKQQLELTRGDLLTFTDDLLTPLLDEDFGGGNLVSGILLENDTVANVTRIADEILISMKTAPNPVRLSLDQARTLLQNLESASDCFDVVSELDEGDDDEADFIEDGGTPTPAPEFIEDGATPTADPVFIAGTAMH